MEIFANFFSLTGWTSFKVLTLVLADGRVVSTGSESPDIAGRFIVMLELDREVNF